MESKTMLTIVLVLLVGFAVFQAYQIMSIKNSKVGITGNAVQTVGGNIDTTGWTEEEKMMYDHHGTLPARLQGSAIGAQAPSSGMVGGC